VIGRRVWKYLKIAKQAAAAAMCLIVCPLRIQDGSGKMNRTAIEFRHFGVKSKEQFLLKALSRKSETP
jgi:hypothetical protein